MKRIRNGKHNSYTIQLYIFLFVSLRSEHNILTQYNLIFVICRSTLKYKDLINYKMNTNNLKVCLLFLCIAAIIVFVETELVEIGFIVLQNLFQNVFYCVRRLVVHATCIPSFQKDCQVVCCNKLRIIFIVIIKSVIMKIIIRHTQLMAVPDLIFSIG